MIDWILRPIVWWKTRHMRSFLKTTEWLMKEAFEFDEKAGKGERNMGNPSSETTEVAEVHAMPFRPLKPLLDETLSRNPRRGKVSKEAGRG